VIDYDKVGESGRARRGAQVHGHRGRGTPAVVVDEGEIGEASHAHRRGQSRWGHTWRGVDGAARDAGGVDGATCGAGTVDGAMRGAGMIDGAARGTSRSASEGVGATRGAGGFNGAARGMGNSAR
jgi:hypothetical protein